MPIDADAYMAGQVPALSRGGSWVPYDTSSTQSSIPGGANQHMPVSQPSIYSGMQQQALGGFFQNPLMLGRMAAFGSAASPSSAGTKPQRPVLSKRATHDGSQRVPGSPNHRQALSVVTGSQVSLGSRGTHTGSPLKYGGWSGGSGGRKDPGSPQDSGSERRSLGGSATSFGSRGFGEGRKKWEEGSWESGVGAPRPMPAEADYMSSLRPPGPKSLPVSPVKREEEKRKFMSQPRMRCPERLSGLGEGISPSRSSFRPSPLSGITHGIQEEEEKRAQGSPSLRKTAHLAHTRPTISRRHTEDPPPHSPSLRSNGHSTPQTAFGIPQGIQEEEDRYSPLPRKTAHFAPARPSISRRHTDEFIAPPPPSQRSRRLSNPQPAFDMKSIADALAQTEARRPPKYMSPSADEGYDRYAAHPAVLSPTTVNRSQNQQRDSAPTGQTEYIPMGYARPTREIEWNRDGPAMRTHGVAWKREADVLPVAPEGPRWVQARPPRAVEVQSGGYWESGGD
jgi:hypothetical protein